MSIEIRRMNVRCQVVVAPEPLPPAAARTPPSEASELRQQILAQCRAWLRDELRRTRER